MCTFILATCDKNAKEELLRKTLNLRNFAFKPIAQPPKEWKVEPEQKWRLATGFYCDCGTVIGIRRSESHKLNEKNLERKLIKLKQKGWSESRIKRWLEDREKPIIRGLEDSKVLELNNWKSAIVAVMETKSTKHFGIFHHFVSGSYDDYEGCLAVQKVQYEELTDEHLTHLPENTLLLIQF
jgi:hypothetical protein